MKKLIVILCTLLGASIALFTACSSPSATVQTGPGTADENALPPSSGYPVTITDFLGNTVRIESADRIVSLSSSGTQTLMALDAEDRIVGVDSYSAEFLPGIETVGDYTAPDVEKIAALNPDLVVAADRIQAETVDQLRSLGIPAIAAEATSWDQVPKSFTMLGEAVDNPAGAEALCTQLTRAVEDAVAAAPAKSPTCYYVLSYGNAGNWTSGEGSFINTMIEYAGGTPVTKGTSYPWLEYPMEDLAAADPDVILFASDAGSIEDFMHTPGYESLAAVKSGRVYEIASDLVDLPSPALTEGLAAVSEIIGDAASAHSASGA